MSDLSINGVIVTAIEKRLRQTNSSYIVEITRVEAVNPCLVVSYTVTPCPEHAKYLTTYRRLAVFAKDPVLSVVRGGLCYKSDTILG